MDVEIFWIEDGKGKLLRVLEQLEDLRMGMELLLTYLKI
jgi:hypothetical protein